MLVPETIELRTSLLKIRHITKSIGKAKRPSEDHSHYLKQLKAQYKTLLKEKKSAALKESWQRLIA
ncbi:hypothetical protein E2320_022697, partial [Naja naja]